MAEPLDLDARLSVEHDLDLNLFVEAGAGTGKTTTLVKRVVRLFATGRLDEPRQLAAITFTEAAASELRDRIRARLEAAGSSSEGLDRPGRARPLRRGRGPHRRGHHHHPARLRPAHPRRAPHRRRAPAGLRGRGGHRRRARGARALGGLRRRAARRPRARAAPRARRHPGAPPRPPPGDRPAHEGALAPAPRGRRPATGAGAARRARPRRRRAAGGGRAPRRARRVGPRRRAGRHPVVGPRHRPAPLRGRRPVRRRARDGPLPRRAVVAAHGRHPGRVGQGRQGRGGRAPRRGGERSRTSTSRRCAPPSWRPCCRGSPRSRSPGPTSAAASAGSTSTTCSCWRSACSGATPRCAATLAERWRVLLVDEFQDTDPLQVELVFALAAADPVRAAPGLGRHRARPRPGAGRGRPQAVDLRLPRRRHHPLEPHTAALRRRRRHR